MNSTEERVALHHTPISRMFRGDPFARFLWKQGITPVRLGLLVFAYGLIYGLILPALFGRLGEVFQDWPTLVIVLVVNPVLLGYYAWEPFSIQNLYEGIARRVQEDKYEDEQISRLTRPFGKRYWFWLALLAGVLESVYIIYQHGYAATNWQSNPIVVATVVPLRFLAFYAVTFILVRETIAILGVNRFMRIFPVDIAPLHPDKAGGLRVLGYYVLARGVVLGLVGLLFGMNLLRARMGIGTLSWEFYLEMIVYVIAAPSLFLLPLWRAHLLMAEAREKIMLEVAQKFELEYYNSLDHIRAGTITGDHVGEIESLQKLYEIAEKAPIWPLNMQIVSQFSAAVLLPVFLPMTIDFIGSLVRNGLLLGR
jgi:hypothetical protein